MKRTLSILLVFGLLPILVACEHQNPVSPQEADLVPLQEADPGLSKAAGGTNFHFVSLSTAAIIGGVHHTFLMAGDGVITPGNVVGNGTFQHTDTDPAKPIPKPILAEGTWKAKRLVNWAPIGSYGVVVAGVLKMEVNLVPDGGPSFPAMLEVVCNIPPGDLFTGKPEGYVLDTGGPPGPFTPLGPPLGITWFTNSIEFKD